MTAPIGSSATDELSTARACHACRREERLLTDDGAAADGLIFACPATFASQLVAPIGCYDLRRLPPRTLNFYDTLLGCPRTDDTTEPGRSHAYSSPADA